MRNVFLALSAVAALALPAAAGEHHVPSEHETIQEAVSVAVNGDIIFISGGHYPESVLIAGKNNVRLVAKGLVVIDPPDGEVGVTLDGSTNCTLERLRIGGGSPWGIHIVDGHDNHLLKCRVDGAAQAGIRLDGGHNQTLEKCIVKGGVGDGIALGTGTAEAVDDCLLLQCTLDKVGGDGVSVNGSNNVFERCLVLKPGGNGFVEDTTTPGLMNRFDRCKVVQPGAAGFLVRNDNATLSRVRVVKSTGDGVLLESGIDAAVEDSRIVKPTGAGVRVLGGGAALSDGHVSGALGDALVIGADSPTVTGWKLSGAKGNGCSMAGNNGSFEDNKVSGSGLNGFVLEDGAQGNVLSGNKASGSGEFDLFDDSGDPQANDYEDNNNKFKTIGVTVPEG